MNLRETAKCLLHDFDIHKPGSIFERKELSISINNAYDLQFEVAAMRESRGERIAGYKIGCISDTMQRQLGIEQPYLATFGTQKSIRPVLSWTLKTLMGWQSKASSQSDSLTTSPPPDG